MSTTNETIVHADLAPNCGFHIERCDACGSESFASESWLWEPSHWPSDNPRRPFVLCGPCVAMVRRRGLVGLQRLLSKYATRMRTRINSLDGSILMLKRFPEADVRIAEPVVWGEVPF